jgi:hypothetical protein
MSAQRTSTTRRLSRPATAALVLAIALPAALVATGGELYQWKDANGVTHYSDAPPPGQTSYENRSIRNSGGTADAPEKAEAPVESEQCTTARANLALLQGDGKVGTDTDGDGKPDTELSADQRANEAELAAAAIKVHCKAN